MSGRRSPFDREDRRRTVPVPLEDREHGTRSTFLYGCRCEPCKEASREYRRKHSKRESA